MSTTIENKDTIIKIMKKPQASKEGTKSTESAFTGTGGEDLASTSTNTDDAVRKETDLERKEDKARKEDRPKSATSKDEARRNLRDKWTKYARYFKRMYDYLVRAEMLHPYTNRAKDIAIKYKANNNSLMPNWQTRTCKLKNEVTYESVREGINVVVRSAIKLNDKHISFIKAIKDKNNNWDKFNEEMLNELKPAQGLMDVKTKETDVRCGSFSTNPRAITNLVAEICNDKFFTFTISDVFKMHLIPLLRTLVTEANNMVNNPGWDENAISLSMVSDCVVYVKSIVETMKVCIAAPLQVAEASLKKETP